MVIDDASVGGGQQHVLWLAERLNGAGFEVAVACAPSGYLVHEISQRGIRHFPISMANLPSPRALMRLREILREFRPAIVHTHGGTAGVTGRIAPAMFGRTRVIHTYHGYHYLKDRAWRRYVFSEIESMLLRITDRIICVAPQDVLTGIRAGIVDPSKTVVIRNGIDTGRYHPKSSYHIPVNPLVGTVGRLHPQKGHRYLLEAIPGIVQEFPRVKFTLVGDGELKEELQALSLALGLSGRVEFTGVRSDVSSLMQSLDVFVLPSLWEGLPIVLLEAMATGLPIVATDVDGVGEILTNEESALLVQPGDRRALSQAVVRLLGDEKLRRSLGSAALRRVREQYGIERMVRETETVYRSLLS